MTLQEDIEEYVQLTAEYLLLIASGITDGELDALGFSAYYDIFKMAHSELEASGVDHPHHRCAVASL